jgi:hypothetical protein
MQSLLLPATHVVLGSAERSYWRLAEPLWEVVELPPPAILPRPSVYVVPRGLEISPAQLGAIRNGYWEVFAAPGAEVPTRALDALRPRPEWGPELSQRYLQTLSWTRRKLQKLDRRLHRDRAGQALGMEPERLRQKLFPTGRPQERMLPGILWLRDEPLLDRMLEALSHPGETLFVEES